MREITFQEVGMKNFGPYIETMILTFKNDSLVLIRGPNGIGKTMALDAIPFTLYGETSKKAKGDDVVNNQIGKNCHTWVKFTLNADEYKVNRYHKFTRMGNTVILNKNGVDIKKGQREVLPEIERMLCPKKSFMNTLMFGQKIKDFFTDLLDSDKKEIFRKILDLDIFHVYYKKADELLKEELQSKEKIDTQIKIDNGVLDEVKTQISILLEAEKQFEKDKNDKLKNLNKTLEECDRMIENWEGQLVEAEKLDHDITKISTEISKVKNNLGSIGEKRENEINQLFSQSSTKEAELNNEALEAKSKIRDAYQKEIDAQNKALREVEDETKEELDKLVEERSNLTSKLSKWENTIWMSENQIDDFQHSINSKESICPTCLQDMDAACISHLKDEINKLDLIVKENQEKVNQAKSRFDVIYKEMKINSDRIRAENEIVKKNIEDCKVYRDQQLNDADLRLKSAIIKLKSFLEKKKEEIIENYKNEESNFRKQLEILLSEKKVVEENIKKIEEIKDSLNNIKKNKEWALKEIEEVENSEYDKNQLKSQYRRQEQLKSSIEQNQELSKTTELKVNKYSFWKSAFSSTGIPSMLIDEAIPFMNKQVSEYLEKMTNGRYIVSFDTLASTKTGEFRDKISVNVLDTNTGANSRIQLSGGQTRIIDIATILTLGDLQSNIQNVNFNILLFDEIFDALDDENISYVSKVLSKMKCGKSIYVISHTHVDQLEANEVLVMH